MKKHLRLIFCALLAVASVSCDKPELQDESAKVTLTLNASLVKFESAGGEKAIELSTTAESWTASLTSSATWCTVTPLSGSGNSTLTLVAEANMTEARRTATLKVSAEGCEDVQISIAQDGQAGKTGLYSDPEVLNADKPCTLYYKVDKTSPLWGSPELYAHIGINSWENVQADWGNNIEKCKWTKTDTDNVWALKMEPSIREWFGVKENEIFRIAMVIRNANGSAQTSDMFMNVVDDKFAFTPDPVIEEPIPSGAEYGITVNPDNTVTFVLYDKDKVGKNYDWCYLIGDFNDWERSSDYIMKRDPERAAWWITLSDLEADKEYMFQYMIGGQFERIRLSDPYSEVTYSYDDQYIDAGTYPDIPKYPAKASGYVSAFRINKEQYAWQYPDFTVEDSDDLIIYELLLRDFTLNGGKEGNLELAKEKLEYLKNLGVNAIELMPVQEFDGNDSWGYNPNHYFAMDKVYGTPQMYKEFIDACHELGMAVIVDVVYNHLSEQSPLVKLYADGNAVAKNNPWFNVVAPHPYSVFQDLNHQNYMVRYHVKRSLEYLIEEYNIDGFRFDLTKGFTQEKSTEGDAGNYDASRIEILKDYYSHIMSVKPDAVVILEHFCELKEEKELGEAGMKVWRNYNEAYRKTAKGENADFSGIYTDDKVPFGTYVGFMESHDEERMGYEQTTNASLKNNLALRMKRLGLNAAFCLLVPGPKMIWQFGEMGYDVTIEHNGRTGKKTPKWEYLNVPERKTLHDTYVELLKFRKDNPRFFDEDASFKWDVSKTEKTMECTVDGKTFHVIGNFATAEADCSLPAGTWKDYFNNGASVSGETIRLAPGEFKLLTNF